MQAYLTRPSSRNCFSFWTGMRGSFPQCGLPFREAHSASAQEGAAWWKSNLYVVARQQEVDLEVPKLRDCLGGVGALYYARAAVDPAGTTRSGCGVVAPPGGLGGSRLAEGTSCRTSALGRG